MYKFMSLVTMSLAERDAIYRLRNIKNMTLGPEDLKGWMLFKNPPSTHSRLRKTLYNSEQVRQCQVVPLPCDLRRLPQLELRHALLVWQ